MTEQIFAIWKYFFQYDVKYITIGGFAVNFHGYNRSTGDIDLLLEDSTENRHKLRNAFIEIGLGDIKELETMQFVAGWTEFSLNNGFSLDLMTSIKGLENKPFDELFEVANETTIDGVSIKFIDYENLIIAKKATNRPKDILDIEELEKINKKSDS
ncbi:nucleotidyltransferase [Flavobacterium sp.]|jgi:predicted nucleotidyltransferase|uniref:nucleotidyltransferase n=1 Tax=Flavobacterium sp. TaxID=239 RepID=UPI0037C14A08